MQWMYFNILFDLRSIIYVTFKLNVGHCKLFSISRLQVRSRTFMIYSETPNFVTQNVSTFYYE